MCRIPYTLPPNLQCGGNEYSQLTSEQQSDVYDELLRRCHSIEILQRERVILDTGPLPMSIAKKPGLRIENFVATPKRDPTLRKTKAVALDCEWARAKDRRSELLSICSVDFLTGRTLINSLVAPSQPISEWRSHVHGISTDIIEGITREYECLGGWEEARTKLFEYIDSETILVGHSVCDDLRLLRIFHKTIVDSQVLAADAVFKNAKKRPGYKWPIDKVCEGFLGISIHQNVSGNQGYNCLENVLASREIVLNCIQRPKDLEKWEKQEREEFWKPKDRKKAIKAGASTADRKYSSVAGSAADQTVNGTAEQQTQLSNHIPDRDKSLNLDSIAFISGYQTAYQTAFQNGFQIGYERRSQEADMEINQTWKKYEDQDRCRYKNQRNSWYTDHDADEKNLADDRSAKLDQRDHRTLNHAIEKGSPLVQLLEEIQTEKRARRANQNGDQNAMIKSEQIENLVETPERYVDKKGEQTVILKPKKKLNRNGEDLEKAQKKASRKASKKDSKKDSRKASKKARRMEKKKVKQEAKKKAEMKFKERVDRKSKGGAERKIITDGPPEETQTAVWQALWGFEEVIQEEQDSESVVEGVITPDSES